MSAARHAFALLRRNGTRRVLSLSVTNPSPAKDRRPHKVSLADIGKLPHYIQNQFLLIVYSVVID